MLCSLDKKAFLNVSVLVLKSGVGQDLVMCSGQEYDPPRRVAMLAVTDPEWNELPAHRLTLRVSGVDRQAADTPGTSQSPSRGSFGNSYAYRQSLQLNTQMTVSMNAHDCQKETRKLRVICFMWFW